MLEILHRMQIDHLSFMRRICYLPTSVYIGTLARRILNDFPNIRKIFSPLLNRSLFYNVCKCGNGDVRHRYFLGERSTVSFGPSYKGQIYKCKVFEGYKGVMFAVCFLALLYLFACPCVPTIFRLILNGNIHLGVKYRFYSLSLKQLFSERQP